ncbi:MAG: sulfite exporter TauE/SafE family protein [Candidatus Bathyarchaeota archaeon]|nr:sulfite exporter TauE/SafE family protein [Candidatus Bathyarchaeota archaeon]
MIEILLPILGFLIGTVASMIGVGGGVFIVPLLTLSYDFSPAQAAGTSLTTIIFTSLASATNYSRQKRIYYKTGLILATTTVPGAFVGAYLTSIIEARLLGLIFGVFLLFVALRMIFKLSFSRSKHSDTEKTTHHGLVYSESSLFESKTKILLGMMLSFFGGLSSGLLGIGGGSLMVPIMTLAMDIPIHITVATSMFTMIFTSTSGVIQHFSLGNIRFEYALLLVLGTIFGAQLGAFTSKRISSRNLRRIFGMVLILVSMRMILRFI